MKLIYIAPLVIIGIAYAGDYCGGGTFTEVSGECKFICDDDTYIDIDDLTFDMIKDNCGDTAAAIAINDDCNSMDDLVFLPAYVDCQCPFCKCSMEDRDGQTSEVFKYSVDDSIVNPSKSCFNCTCTDVSDNANFEDGTTFINICEELGEGQELDGYSCPPMQCSITMWGQEYIVSGGTYWTADVEDGEKCDTLCYCDSTDGEICKTGWENIVDNDKMTNYLRECNYAAGAVK